MKIQKSIYAYFTHHGSAGKKPHAQKNKHGFWKEPRMRFHRNAVVAKIQFFTKKILAEGSPCAK